jgi:hypothetical protein
VLRLKKNKLKKTDYKPGEQALAPFGCADKPAEKYCWLIYYERKILFQLKKPAKKYGL